ncbi:ferredoxin [Mycolicibacterium litorale]|uniref:Ferredoxin n=1 Tax=Mycolicibacterium litorale TaxID=758802 RepID=A0A6S6NZ00_9MYCO|nr:ferredoxin [Mycolicibacterium litorale]BCI51285.1 ferredoxin [Mycolicibacterium litorale]
MRIDVDRDACISAGNCVMSAPEVFDQDDDGIVVLLADPVPEAEFDRARQAVTLCPAAALRLAPE